MPTIPTTIQHSGNESTKMQQKWLYLKPWDKKDGLKKDICKNYKEKE